MAQAQQTGGEGANVRRVIVVGAGFAGICATHNFRRIGEPIAAVEAGGVCYRICFPRARCELDWEQGCNEDVFTLSSRGAPADRGISG